MPFRSLSPDSFLLRCIGHRCWLATAICLVTGCSEPSPVDRAEDLFGEGRYDAAIQFIDQQLANAEQLDRESHMELLNCKGTCLYHKSDQAYQAKDDELRKKLLLEAYDVLTESFQLEPKNPDALLVRSLVLRGLGRHREAAADQQARRRLDPTLAAAFSDPPPSSAPPRDSQPAQDDSLADGDEDSPGQEDSRPFGRRRRGLNDPAGHHGSRGNEALAAETDEEASGDGVERPGTAPRRNSLVDRQSPTANRRDERQTRQAREAEAEEARDKQRFARDDNSDSRDEQPRRLTEDESQRRRIPSSTYPEGALPETRQFGSSNATTGRMPQTSYSGYGNSRLGTLGEVPSTGITGPSLSLPSLGTGNATGLGAAPALSSGATGLGSGSSMTGLGGGATGLGVSHLPSMSRPQASGQLPGYVSRMPAASSGPAGSPAMDAGLPPDGGIGGVGVSAPGFGVNRWQATSWGPNSFQPDLRSTAPSGLGSHSLGSQSPVVPNSHPGSSNGQAGAAKQTTAPTSVVPKVKNFGASLPKGFGPEKPQPTPGYRRPY